MAVPQHTYSQPEVWKPIPNYEGMYEVSNYGRVRSCDREIKYKNKRGTEVTMFRKGRDLPSRIRGNGYPCVDLWKRNKATQFTVHTLVLEAFVGPRPDGHVCCHKDDVKTNNYIGNLRWGTYSENSYDKVANGGDHNANKKYCSRGHLLAAPNLVPSKLKVGVRDCLACSRARNHVGYHKGLKPQLKEYSDAYYAKIIGN